MNRKAQVTLCGIRPRAFVASHQGHLFTFRWPCGYQRTEPFLVGPKGHQKPAGAAQVAFHAKYWREGQGVSYECPRCRRAALKLARDLAILRENFREHNRPTFRCACPLCDDYRRLSGGAK